MSLDPSASRWLDRVVRGAGPVYLAIVEALEAALRDGELQAGDQLPPQRAVAQRLGVDFTTVTRAYAAARSRGLVEGAVGRGTFIRARAAEDEVGLVDLSMNLPPPPQGVSLANLLRDTTRAVLERTDPAALMAYHPGAGTLGQKLAAASWLAPCLGPVEPERVLICPGAQTGLAAILAAITRPGDTLAVEPLTYPGLIALARQLGLTLAACPVDADGPLPEALDRLCHERRPAGLYLVPAMQNPVASTIPPQRRRDLVEVLRARDIALIEDDPYSRLFDAPIPALTSLAPERGYYLATLSKTLSPGLRTAFLVTPPRESAARVAASLRATSLMAPPLMTAVVSSWIREGAAEALLAGVRAEARARRALASHILPTALGTPEGLHVWLDLPRDRDPARLRLAAQQRGLSLVTADAFAATPDHPNGMRISLGGPAKHAVLAEALRTVAGLLDGEGAARVVV